MERMARAPAAPPKELGALMVARLNSAGVAEWALNTGGGTGCDLLAPRLAPTSDEGALVASSFRGTASLGSTTVVSTGDTFDIFVLRVTTGGEVDWAIGMGGSGTNIMEGIAATPRDGALVAASFAGTATFLSTTFEGDERVYSAVALKLEDTRSRLSCVKAQVIHVHDGACYGSAGKPLHTWMGIYNISAEECAELVLQQSCSRSYFIHATDGDGNCGCMAAESSLADCVDYRLGSWGVHTYAIAPA